MPSGDSSNRDRRRGYESPVSNHHVNLTPQENSLIAEAHPDAVARMDAKSLKDLQSRLRQAREKNFSLLRRQGAARVEAEGARGATQPANEKRGEKVEIFDEALARVSQHLEAFSDTE
jgi:DNA-binding MarR family transcriptional regulator